MSRPFFLDGERVLMPMQQHVIMKMGFVNVDLEHCFQRTNYQRMLIRAEREWHDLHGYL